jgi:hypothetical protein
MHRQTALRVRWWQVWYLHTLAWRVCICKHSLTVWDSTNRVSYYMQEVYRAHRSLWHVVL